MEINYETIIKYLGNIKPKEELNISQKNIYTYLKNISSKFQDLFCDKIYKYGEKCYKYTTRAEICDSTKRIIDISHKEQMKTKEEKEK